MSLFDTLKQITTGKPLTIKSPVFAKEFDDKHEIFAEMEALMETAPPDIKRKIALDLSLMKAGISGESNVSYELVNSRLPMLILHDLSIEYNGLTSQIDFVLIEQHFVLVVECKKLVGDIEITEKGDFIRCLKNKYGKIYEKQGMYNPVSQNGKHVEIVKDIMQLCLKRVSEKGLSALVKSVVVIANPKTVLHDSHAPEEIRRQIVRCDQLIPYMRDLEHKNEGSYWIEEDGMKHLAETLLKYHHPKKRDYAKHYSCAAERQEPKNAPPPSYESNTPGTPNAEELRERLRKYRWKKSVEEKIKPYFIFTNAEMDVLLEAAPHTLDELAKVRGFGAVKCQKYGADILEILRG